MPKYGNTYYQQGYYGQKSTLAYAVDPFYANAIDYGLVSLSWASPQGSFIGARLVRNQDAFPETPEDGVIIWSEYPSTSALSRSTFLDGFDNLEDDDPLNDIAIVSGRYAYYRMWIQKLDSTWVVAGDTYTIVPKNHSTKANHTDDIVSTHNKVMDLIPKVFTSATHSPIDEVDYSSSLSRFLEGFSFTMDEMLTLSDLIKPEVSGRNMNPTLVGLRANELGLTPEPGLNIKLQKRLNREALYMYSRKGTLSALKTLVESVTGFSTKLTVSPNLMLTNQDSTFNKSIGSWLPANGCTISLENAVAPPTTADLAIELSYTATVVADTDNAKISNGADSPITKGIPVTPGVDYGFSFHAKMADGTGGILADIKWYNYLGEELSESHTPMTNPISTTWSRGGSAYTAPADAAYASLELTFTTAGTYHLDMLQFADTTATLVYNEARGVDIFLYPKKYNYIENPSFYPTVDEDIDWVVTPGLTSEYVTPTTLTHVADGSHMLVIGLADGDVSSVSTQTTAGVVDTGTYYTASIYAKVDANTETMDLTIAASDTDNLSLSATATTSVVITTDWARYQVTVFVPATFNAATTTFEMSLSGTTAGNTLSLDAAQLEPYFYATDYFDGDLVGFGGVWGADANDSPSYQYPEKAIKIIRLIDEVNKFIPKNTPWTITTYGGLEASGIS